ncbi:MAG: hypothetical protein L6U16_08155 [Porphyromonadaceae bacterium]|nr:MAG: hypothetical protein L6U16_08155 [Porphyromonadaceae bacterium]
MLLLTATSAYAGSDVLATKHGPESKLRLNRPAANAVPEAKPRKAVSVANVNPAATTVAKVPGSNTVLCGVKVYDDAWVAEGATIDAGIYTVEAKENGIIKSVKESKEWMYTRAAIKNWRAPTMCLPQTSQAKPVITATIPPPLGLREAVVKSTL